MAFLEPTIDTRLIGSLVASTQERVVKKAKRKSKGKKKAVSPRDIFK